MERRAGIDFQGKEEAREQNGTEFLAILAIAREHLERFVKVINRVTKNFEEIPTFKRLDDIVHTFWFRRRDAEPQLLLSFNLFAPRRNTNMLPTRLYMDYLWEIHKKSQFIQMTQASSRLIDTLLVMHAKVNDQLIIAKVEVLGDFAKSVMEAWNVFFDATDDLIKGSSELQIKFQVGDQIRYLKSIARGKMIQYLDGIERIFRSLRVCGKNCTFKISQEIRACVSSSREFFHSPSKKIQDMLRSQSKVDVTRLANATLPQSDFFPGWEMGGVKEEKELLTPGKFFDIRNDVTARGSTILSKSSHSSHFSASANNNPVAKDDKSVYHSIKSKVISKPIRCTPRKAGERQYKPKTLCKRLPKRKFDDRDRCVASCSYRSTKRVKTENVKHKTQTHLPKSPRIARQASIRTNSCVTTLSLEGSKRTSNCHNERTNSFKPDETKQTSSSLSKQTTPVSVDSKRTNITHKPRLPHTVRMIPISIFDPTLLDSMKPKQKCLNNSKQTNIQ